MSVEQQFQERAAAVPKLGLGLSVDVYSPDLWELMGRFENHGCRPAYLEIFRATTTALEAVRQAFPEIPLAYHGEGLWITQPEFRSARFFEDEVGEIVSQLHILSSPWLNHECATKQMGGYSFGTYLPPLYTPESAALVANHTALVQERLDENRTGRNPFGPLFLLEMPPLTYFMAGTIGVPEYFHLITERTPCGLVLDIGHLWTVYRYSTALRRSSLEAFVAEFLDAFPLERVIEIHVAGLAVHEAVSPAAPAPLPEWIDAHAAPVPAVSWTILDQVLGHCRLQNLRAVALEVDTKPVERIVEEFTEASARVRPTVERLLKQQTSDLHKAACDAVLCLFTDEIDRDALQDEYVRYAQIALGQRPPAGAPWTAVAEDPSGLERYVGGYLVHEIVHWGGDIADMFPQTCRALKEQGACLDDFVRWWRYQATTADRPYDFFLLKIDRLLEFVTERAPLLLEGAVREAAVLRKAYADANMVGRSVLESCR
jgi:uncharacterized protein (UPF0276 family)